MNQSQMKLLIFKPLKEKGKMALRGAAAAWNVARQTNKHPIIHSIPQYLRTGFHRSLSHPVQRFSSSPSFQHELKYPIRAVHEAAADPIASKKEEEGKSSQDWRIKMLYDGDCPLCMREVNMLRERNKSYGTVKFVDISSDEYSPEENQGLDYKTVMGRIHAILSDGTVVTDVEVCIFSFTLL
uniref:Uncharacterized protein MANES_14G069600 n=1 Tax=Rhizophora mucronata TaxID=61149 RepID=A0A2P2IRW2_RHIMU